MNDKLLTDKSLMPWGKYKGQRMRDIPDDYFLYLWENEKCSGAVKEYIEDNLDAIKINVERSKKKLCQTQNQQ